MVREAERRIRVRNLFSYATIYYSMVSNLLDDLSEEEYNFIASVIEDSNYEFPISNDEEYSLFTDWEGDGFFLPTVTVMHNVNEDEESAERERVDNLMQEFDWFEYSRITDVENDEHSGVAHVYFDSNVSIASDVEDAVAESL